MRTRLHAPAAALAALLGATLARPATAQRVTASSGEARQRVAPPGAEYSYRFSFGSSGEKEPATGMVHVRGDVARIDMNRHGKRGRGDNGWFLVTDGGRTMITVDPDRSEYKEGPSDDFVRIVGTALRAVPVLTVRLQDLSIRAESLGGGGTIAGYSTQHYRLTREFGVTIGAMGFTGDPEWHVVSADYWVHPGLRLARNPLLEMFEGVGAALAQSDAEFVARSEAARARLLPGTPLRVIVTAGKGSPKSGEVSTETTTIEIFDLRPGPQPAELFRIPEGFERRSGNQWNVSF